MYPILKTVLFWFDPERIHHFVFRLLRVWFSIPGTFGLTRLFYSPSKPKSVKLFGLHFPGRVGLAAGFDKDAYLNDNWEAFGFAFMEVGTVTPLAQKGNPSPRLFRLPKDQALLNRMGFNSQGLEEMVGRLKKSKKRNIIIGGNIGKNKDTPNENALNDYLKCFDALFSYVDYFTINVSSPNTPGLRELQEKEPLTKLLKGLIDRNASFAKPKPILLKISPDLNEAQLDDIIEIVKSTGIAGIVAGNTTLSRDGLHTDSGHLEKMGAGGISGQPLTEKSKLLVRMIHQKSKGSIPIIGVGGIMTGDDAVEMMKAGASLVQIYTGFVYQGPGINKRIEKAISTFMA